VEFNNFTTSAPPLRTTTVPLDALVLALDAGYCASSFWLQNHFVFWEFLGNRRTPSKWSASDTRLNRWTIGNEIRNGILSVTNRHPTPLLRHIILAPAALSSSDPTLRL